MKINKLDSRYNGYDLFKYGIDFKSSELHKFCEIREWCWQQFGPSCELDIFRQNPNSRYQDWAWLRDSTRTRLYFMSEKELQWFLLKWGNK